MLLLVMGVCVPVPVAVGVATTAAVVVGIAGAVTVDDHIPRCQ